MFLDDFVEYVGDESGKIGRYFRSSPGIESYPHALLLLLSLANEVSTSLALIGESSNFGEPSNMSMPCSIPSGN